MGSGESGQKRRRLRRVAIQPKGELQMFSLSEQVNG